MTGRSASPPGRRRAARSRGRPLLALALFALAAAARAEPAAIANGDFEQAGAAGLPAGWQVDAWGRGASVALTRARVRTGRTALLIESPDLNDVRLIQTVAVRPGTIYRFRGWVATEGVTAGGAGANLSVLGTVLCSEGTTGDTAWHPVELVFRTNEAQTRVILAVRLGFYGSAATGRAYFDDVSLVELDDPGVAYRQINAAVAAGGDERGTAEDWTSSSFRRWMELAAAVAILWLAATAGLAVWQRHAPPPSRDPDAGASAPGPAIAGASFPPRHGRRDGWLAGGATAVFAVLLALALSRHEMWRDEIQAWLLARDTPRWWGIFSAIRYEGHPGLWHFLLWPLAHLTWNPVAMQVLHGAVATVTAWLIFRRAPFPWAVRLLLPFGYFLFYEWGVISRNYGLSALLFAAFCSAYARRWHAFPWAALALALACHTNIQSIILVMALAPVLAAEYAVAAVRRRRGADRAGRRVGAGFALIAIGLASAVLQARPPPDSSLAPGWHTFWDDERAQLVAASLARAYVPVPEVRPDWWNSCRLTGTGLAGEGRLRLPPFAAPAFAVLAMAGLAALLVRRPWPMLAWTLGTLGLLVFAYVKYRGFARHDGFHLLWLLVVFWMARSSEPLALPWAGPARLWPRAEAWGFGLILAGVSALQAWAAAAAAGADWGQVFAAGPLAAAWLREHGYVESRYCFAGQAAPEVSAVVGLARLASVRYVAPGRDGSYVIWRTGDDERIPDDRLLRVLADYRDGQGKDLVFLSGDPIDPALRPRDLREIAAFDPPSRLDAVWVYLWPRGSSPPPGGPPARGVAP